MSRSPAEIAALVAESLMAGSGGLKQICIDCDIADHHTELVKKYVEAFRRHGRVRISGWSRQHRAIYSWQDMPWLEPDVPRPNPAQAKPRDADRKTTKRRAIVEVAAGTPNSVFALGGAA